MTDVWYRGSDGWPLFANVVEDSSAAADRDVSPVVLLHGGGPDHEMFLPLAHTLADRRTVVLPDVRGYGKSKCADEARHTWSQYAADVLALLDHLAVPRAIIGGAGLGTTIALRTAAAYRDRVEGLVLISVEDIEDDEKKAAEITFMAAFAERARRHGVEAAWAPILGDLAPVIGVLVRDAIPRSDAASIAAAAAIGRDRSFRTVSELATIDVPALIFPGMDSRHPPALAEELARVMPHADLAKVRVLEGVRSADDFARAFGPPIRNFLSDLEGRERN